MKALFSIPPIHNPLIPSWVYLDAGPHIPQIIPVRGTPNLRMSLRHHSAPFMSVVTVHSTLYNTYFGSSTNSYVDDNWHMVLKAFKLHGPRD
jgi:hypothetical protein